MKRQLEELIAQYNLKVKRVEPNRSNYYLSTDKGMYVLRKVIVPIEQIEFEYEVTKFLEQKNFVAMDSLYLNKHERPYSMYHDKAYVLQSHRKNHEIDFKNIEDLKEIVALLARFHREGKGLQSQKRKIENITMKNVYQYFNKRYTESQRLKKKISKCSSKTPFEWEFIKGYKEYEELEEYALTCIDLASCDEMVAYAKENYTLVHNDYNYHSVNRSKTGEYFINNFDYCTYNIQITDLAAVLTKVMQKNIWDINLLAELIEQYNTEKTLTDKELGVLKAMLIFPEKYANICQKYLNTKRRTNYSVFEVKWANMLETKEQQLQVARQIQKNL